MMDTCILSNWINLSVFFEKSHWSKIIKDFFKPYISENRINGNMGAFSISFSTEQGEHIRLAFECTSIDQEQFADDLHNQLNSYLISNPSPKPPQNYIGKAFFMDYYNNSIQYNLYKLDIMDNRINEIRSLISERFLNIFEEDEYDQSLLLTFALYIIMTFCNTWKDFYNEDVNLKIEEILYADGCKDDDLKASFKSYYNLFNENKEIIMSIYEEIAESQNENNMAMNIGSLKTCYGKILSESKDYKYSNSYTCLPFDTTVMDCTGMKHDSLSAVYYIIHLCINEVANK